MARTIRERRNRRPVERVRRRDPEDGVELSDEELEVVIGGLEPEAWRAYASYLERLGLRRPVR